MILISTRNCRLLLCMTIRMEQDALVKSVLSRMTFVVSVLHSMQKWLVILFILLMKLVES